MSCPQLRMISRPASCVLLLFLSGCFGTPAGFPDLGGVEGTVTVDGQAAANLAVMFIPDEGRPSLGVTDDQGHYQLSYFQGEVGAVLGQHKVMITTNVTEDAPSDFVEPIPPHYNLQSVLTGDVQAGDNVIDFDLVTDFSEGQQRSPSSSSP